MHVERRVVVGDVTDDATHPMIVTSVTKVTTTDKVARRVAKNTVANMVGEGAVTRGVAEMTPTVPPAKVASTVTRNSIIPNRSLDAEDTQTRKIRNASDAVTKLGVIRASLLVTIRHVFHLPANRDKDLAKKRPSRKLTFLLIKHQWHGYQTSVYSFVGCTFCTNSHLIRFHTKHIICTVEYFAHSSCTHHLTRIHRSCLNITPHQTPTF